MESAAIKHLKSADPIMAKLIKKFGPVRIKARRIPPFQSLVHSVAHQQLTGNVANKILERFRTLAGTEHFPSPEQVLKLDIETLRSVGFSRPKAKYIKHIAEREIAGLIPTLIHCKKLTDAEIVASLTEIKGVGRWTAEMFLMFNLGRPDVLPVHDFGIRKGFQLAYRKRNLPKPEYLERFGKRWSPYRSTASLYMYEAADGLRNDEW
jgi:DNA-3-methyladenine glycosylase II